MIGVTGGSYSEGIDLPGEYLEIVIIVGLPLGILNLETKAMINYYERKFGKGWLYAYKLPALRKALQAAGRVVRNEKDRGVAIFMDTRYKELKEFMNHVEIISDEKELVKKVNEFFRSVDENTFS